MPSFIPSYTEVTPLSSGLLDRTPGRLLLPRPSSVLPGRITTFVSSGKRHPGPSPAFPCPSAGAVPGLPPSPAGLQGVTREFPGFCGFSSKHNKKDPYKVLEIKGRPRHPASSTCSHALG